MDNGMSQEDLAHAMGYKDRSMITKIEAGKVDISQKKILEFAKVLNTTPAYLMGWEDEEPATESPKTHEARILAKGVDQMPQEQREQLLNVFKAIYPQYAGYFEEREKEDHDD